MKVLWNKDSGKDSINWVILLCGMEDIAYGLGIAVIGCATAIAGALVMLSHLMP